MGVSGNGDRELAALGARLAAADTVLRNELRGRWRAALAPAVGAVKTAALAPGVPVRYERGLRKELAATVRSEVSLPVTGARVSIVSEGKKMPPGKRNLNRDTDQGAWRHPVFGTEAQAAAGGRRHGRGWKWVPQVWQAPGWFTVTNVAQQAGFAQAAQRVLDDVGHWIEHG